MATKAVVDNATLDAIGQAIITKGGATAPMKPSEMPAAIAAIPSGGGSADFPFDGWKRDGKIHLWHKAWVAGEEVSYFSTLSISDIVTVDWGDGSSETITIRGTYEFKHTYAAAGFYRIDITCNTFRLQVVGNIFYAAETPFGEISLSLMSGLTLLRYVNNSSGTTSHAEIPSSVVDFEFSGSRILGYKGSMIKRLDFGEIAISPYEANTGGREYQGSGIVEFVANHIPNLDVWMFNNCTALKNVYIDSISQVFPDNKTGDYLSRLPFVGCAALKNVYVRNRTCAEVMAMGYNQVADTYTFPWGYSGTTAVWHCSDGIIKYIDGAWTAVTEEA